ncbi:MAG TPA: helix-turn-helix domain-containing protein [Paucimonas sp.]|nr:helix-turn-helix domain-containing protein [Paucimonas sp.]HJW55991.1 helix-turn-helix domain-containing protein [Burkholderiaceae bacterium]
MEQSLGVARLRTRDVSRWQEGVHEHFLPLDFTARRKEDFLATMTARQLGSAHLACVGADAHCVTRTPVLADRSERRYFKLFWQMSGASRIEQSGKTSELKAGSWTFYDTARPYVIEVSDASRFAVMLIPKELCSSWNAPIVERAGQAFHSSGASRVALASVMTALRDPECYDALAADTVVASISALMLTALKSETVEERQPAVQVRLAQACRYIASRVDNPDLTPDDVATALHVSRRTLYTWFAQNGQSPFAFIQKTRLERCRLTLIDPAGCDKTITHIAFDNGFSDMAYFSRLFKATYGASPREYRKRFTD